MSNQVTLSVVRLINAAGSVAGIGYVTPENRIITCAHMVTQALGIPKDTAQKPDADVTVDFPFVERGKTRTARVVLWRTVYQSAALPLDGMEDTAVLEFADEPQIIAPLATTLGDTDYEYMIDAIRTGQVIPFLGAGVNLCDRAEGERWNATRQYLPSGEELSMALAAEFGYPWSDSGDLLRVSQYVALMHTLDRLNAKLRTIFNRDYPPTSLHEFFARLPSVLRGKGYRPNLLIVTTNYDDLLERAFTQFAQPFDLVTYWIGDQDEQRGKLLHWTMDGKRCPIDDPNKYDGIKLDEQRNLVNPVILKVHGAVDRTTAGFKKPLDSYVITEDHYLEYLTRSDIASLVPAILKEKLKLSSFLFLGYSLRDWNLRVFLNRIQMQQRRDLDIYYSWAIQKQPGDLEQRFWKARNVQIFDAKLRDYVAEIKRRVDLI
ncbi:MAG TPA: SIR2 family protein [Blastocatellia bacterium]|nr:SIR2 family protein [Blastocatellia bacterium]